MNTCIICRFATELDDVVVGSQAGRCICIRCYDRETGHTLRMPVRLRRELLLALADTPEV